jgi:hypothetical protein
MKELIEKEWKGQGHDSKELYDWLVEHVSPEWVSEDKDALIRDQASRLMKDWLDENGNRRFETTTTTGKDGEIRRVWIQPCLMGFEEARKTVDENAKIARSIMRKANALAKRFAEEKGYQIPIPFPWIEEEQTGSEK